MTPAIDVLVPVLGRPWNAARLVDSLRASTKRAHLTFLTSLGDDDQISACLAIPGARVLEMDFSAGPGDYARKINFGYEFGEAPLVLLAADDLKFQPGWLEAVEAVAERYDCGVIGTNDAANPTVIRGEHSTHSVVRRCYIDTYGGVVGEPGMVYWESYDHQMVDNELCQTAMARGCYVHAHDAVVKHRHPIYDKSVSSDATYVKGQARGREDLRLFNSRRHLWMRERVTA